MITTRSQRWRERRDVFVPSSSTINPGEYSVDIVDCSRTARNFIVREHYSGSFPASRLSCGLFRNGPGGTSKLVGVTTFSVPINNAAVPKHTGLTVHTAAADLGRLVLLDEVAGNGESFFLSRAFRLLRQEKPDILSIISYADPMRRFFPDGTLRMPGHVGGVYSLMGAAYRGRTKPRLEAYTPDGQLYSERSISKIRNHETGIGYSIDELVRRGAPPPNGDERAWLEELFATGFLCKRRHNGNHIYVFPLTKAAKLAGRFLPSLAYPVLDRAPHGDDVTSLPLLQAA